MEKLKRWTRMYYPSVLFVLQMVVLYGIILWLFFAFLWPEMYQNGEPIIASTQSTISARIAERTAFQLQYQQACIRMGLVALSIYLLYSVNGLLRIAHAEHTSLCYELRKAMLSFLGVCIIADWWSFFAFAYISETMISAAYGVLQIAGCIILIVSLTQALKCTKILNNVKSKGFRTLILLITACLIAWITCYTEGTFNVIKDLVKSAFPSTGQVLTDAGERFLLMTSADYLLPGLLLLPFIFLFFAAKYAAPISANGPVGGKVRAMIKCE